MEASRRHAPALDHEARELRKAGLSRAYYPGFRQTIKLIGTGQRGSRDLTFDESREAMRALFSGEVTDVQAGAFLLGMRFKGESPAELAGFAKAMRDLAPKLTANTGRPLVASVGAYDGMADAPQLSLACGVLAAACGAGVVMHCGDAVGPKFGTTVAEVLGALGGEALPSAAQSERMLEQSGATVVHTGEVLPGWRKLLELRDQVGVRGPVHSAEKLINYFGAARFIIGHTHGTYSGRLLGALDLLEAEAGIAVRGIEGSDVMRPARPLAYETSRTLELPERLGASMVGDGDPVASAELTRTLLSGEQGGVPGYTVALNASMRLYAAGIVDDPREGIERAENAVHDGSAIGALDAMIAAC